MNQAPNGHAPKVMIVEDEYLISRDISEAILELGLDLVGCARSADEAVAIARQHQPDAVVTDLNLACGPGGERMVELLSSVGSMRYLVVSGDRKACASFGARFPNWPILDKPVRLPVLKQALLALLDIRFPERAV